MVAGRPSICTSADNGGVGGSLTKLAGIMPMTTGQSSTTDTGVLTAGRVQTAATK